MWPALLHSYSNYLILVQVNCEGRSKGQWGKRYSHFILLKKNSHETLTRSFLWFNSRAQESIINMTTIHIHIDRWWAQWENQCVFECNLSSCIPFCHCRQVSMSAVQRPGFQSTGKKVGMQDNKLHKGPQQELALTHAPITVSTVCILFQILLSAPHTPWENICFCTQIPILIPHICVNYSSTHERMHTRTHLVNNKQ